MPKSDISRVELFEKLDAGSKQRLILVSAAGFGKTTLVSGWLNYSGASNIWFSIDIGDNDIVDFVSYILHGAQKIKNDFGQSILALLQSPTHPRTETIISLLINEFIPFKQDIVIVLDDFHQIQNEEILRAMDFLLEHSPENLENLTKLKGKIAVAYSYYGSFIEYSDKSLMYAQTAMQNLTDEDPFWYSWAWFSYGVSYYTKGDLHKSDEAFSKALGMIFICGFLY